MEPENVVEQTISQSETIPQTNVSNLSNSEDDKKIKGILKKLAAIAKLKELQDAGLKLELNQLEKISKENELIEEMQILSLKSF